MVGLQTTGNTIVASIAFKKTVGAVEKVTKGFKLRSQPNFSVYVMAEQKH